MDRLTTSGVIPLEPVFIEPHICDDTDGFEMACIDGDIYGNCESEHCYGACEKYYKCECPCHQKKA